MFGPSTFQAIASLFSVYVPLSMVSSALTEWLGTLTGSRSRILLAGLTRLLGDSGQKYKVNVASEAVKVEKVKTADGKTETKQTNVVTTVQKPLALAILEHPLIQGSTSPSLLGLLPFGLGKRFSQPSYCDPKLLVNALIDVISPAPAASDVRSPGDILLAIDHMPAGEPKRLMQALANSPLTQGENGSFEQALEHWLGNGMERMSGWYKRRAQRVIMLLSALLASGLNVDALALLKNLGVSELPPASIAQAAPSGTAPSGTAPSDAADGKKPPASTKPGPALPDSLNSLGPAYLFDLWQGNASNSVLIQKIAGLLFSTIALTMGAPFYFDLLKKVSNVRLTGVPPDEIKPTSA